MNIEDARERNARQNAERLAGEEIARSTRAEADAAEALLGGAAQRLRTAGSVFWIKLNGCDVDQDGNLVDRSQGYVNSGRWQGTAGLVDARAIVAEMKARAARLGLDVDPVIWRRTTFSFDGVESSVLPVAPERPSRGER